MFDLLKWDCVMFVQFLWVLVVLGFLLLILGYSAVYHQGYFDLDLDIIISDLKFKCYAT